MELWRNEVFIDVIFEVGGVSFWCYRFVLVVMFGYFDVMFLLGMKEFEDYIVIELYGFDKYVVENILFYIYIGKVDIDNVNVDFMFVVLVYF